MVLGTFSPRFLGTIWTGTVHGNIQTNYLLGSYREIVMRSEVILRQLLNFRAPVKGH